MSITRRIESIRMLKNMRQLDLALAIGINQSNYSRLIRLGDNITVSRLRDIAKALDVDILTFFTEEPTTLPDPNLTTLLGKLISIEKDLAHTYHSFHTLIHETTKPVPSSKAY